ncbi:SusD/RagB family nutrient-binding outer membrane lipoprotein [Sphingobacterium pedocola]|uniref:SusD/RagB family nutrient-binding outer membrane lipoprotein n=1 Tax=Sphingobacterium pedocola TaxID=2082722 RepID=A0ABR9T3K1_9SPHI|nr:SusD/RagB family nutrient-binding outer membrane lipoprotein [Sphingobacterium pedocola]MBE8719454.1 SusD/RagB family nutrient-binding outer membrane lipoprotein [Sphingobacterium pedocola]
MKYKLIIILAIVLTSASLHSCKKFLDINDNPNAAENVDPKLLFSFATTAYVNLRSSGDLYIPLALAGQSISSGGNNPTGWGLITEQQYDVSSFSHGNSWSTYYVRGGNNLKQAIQIAETSEPANNNAAAQAKILLALLVYETTTLYGDVPFTEAWNVDISYPNFDPQKTVLEGAISLCDEALAQIDDASPLKIDGLYDMFYGGDLDKWKRLAKSIKLRTLLTMVDADPEKVAQIGQIINEGEASLVNSAADNFFIPYETVANKRNPKYAINLQYNGGVNFFFGSTYVVDFMRAISDPRLPKFFTKPAEADNYYGLEPGANGVNTEHVRISNELHAADAPEVIFTYQEQLFYEAEIYARGLGVAVDIPKANTLLKKAIEESCKFYGVSASEASTFANGLPNISSAADLRYSISYHHWVDKMDRGIDAFTQWRRSGPAGSEVPNLTLPVLAPEGGLFRRFQYPASNEISANPNAPKEAILYFEKTWFDL